MSFSINTNTSALFANAYGKMNQTKIDQSLQRLSTGLKLNYSKDGAAEMAIANSLKSQHMGLTQANKNINDGVGLLQIADSALSIYSDLLHQARDKANQAVSDTNSPEARASLEADVKALMDQAEDISTKTSFNGMNILNGDWNAAAAKKIQTGAYSGETTAVAIEDTKTATLGVDDASLDLTSQAGATAAVTSIDAALTTLGTIRSNIGSTQIALEARLNVNSTTAVNVKAAESQLRDTDYAEEQEKLNKFNIIQQANTFALSKTFEGAQMVLQLLR